MKKRREKKRKKIVPFFLLPTSKAKTFFCVLLFRSHTLVYLLRFFFSLTQHWLLILPVSKDEKKESTNISNHFPALGLSLSTSSFFFAIYFFPHSLFCHAMTWSRENYIATYFPQFPTFEAVMFFLFLFSFFSSLCV